MPTRRSVLKGLLAVMLAGLFSALYGFFIEPALRLKVRRWRIATAKWQGAPLKIAVLADIHMGEPYVTRNRLRRIVRRTNALGADVIVFLGDLNAGHPFVSRHVPLPDSAAELANLSAPAGVYSILGNHDWWDDRAAQRKKRGPIAVRRALEKQGMVVLENDVLRVAANGGAFWIAGLADQLALRKSGGGFTGLDDLPGTLNQITDKAPVILLAHEPDIFPQVPARVCLTLSGHTHGGQVRLFGYSPVVPSRFGNRYAYGHVREGGRDLVVSGGIGCSIAPVRFGVVPEITLIELIEA